MTKKKGSDKYSFDLMVMNNEAFQGKLHKAFTSLESSGLDQKKALVAAKSFEKSLRNKYGFKDAELSRTYNAWKEDKSFSYITSNPHDVVVKEADEFGYDWLMGMSDKELQKKISANPELRKQYGLQTEEEEYESLIRSQHASAEAAGQIKSKTYAGAKSREDYQMKQDRTLTLYSANKMFDSSPFKQDPEVMAAMNFFKGSGDSTENLIDELRRNGLFTESTEEHLRKLSVEHADKYNTNRLNQPSGDSTQKSPMNILESLRLIDNERELSTYYMLADDERSRMIVPTNKKKVQ